LRWVSMFIGLIPYLSNIPCRNVSLGQYRDAASLRWLIVLHLLGTRGRDRRGLIAGPGRLVYDKSAQTSIMRPLPDTGMMFWVSLGLLT